MMESEYKFILKKVRYECLHEMEIITHICTDQNLMII